MQAPESAILANKSIFSGGKMFDKPQPWTAMVRPFALSAPRWAAVSIPRAIPLMIVKPDDASMWANLEACSAP